MSVSNVVAIPDFEGWMGIGDGKSANLVTKSLSGTTGVGTTNINTGATGGNALTLDSWYVVFAMRLNTAEVGKDYEFVVVDQDGITHMSFHDPAGRQTPATASIPVGWDGAVVIPGGSSFASTNSWRVGTNIYGGAGALAYSFQYHVLEIKNMP